MSAKHNEAEQETKKSADRKKDKKKKWHKGT